MKNKPFILSTNIIKNIIYLLRPLINSFINVYFYNSIDITNIGEILLFFDIEIPLEELDSCFYFLLYSSFILYFIIKGQEDEYEKNNKKIDTPDNSIEIIEIN